MHDVLAVAVEIAHEAGALIRERFGRIDQVRFKGAVNPVTETDTAAEAVILSRLRAAFPEHGILGEESGGDAWQVSRLAPSRLAKSEAMWLVDPLDGTNNFAHGFPHICVSLGLMVSGAIEVGVVYDPLRDETFAALRGAGATLNGVAIRVSTVDSLSRAFLATGFPYDRRVGASNNVGMLDCFLRRSQGVRRAGSAALDLAYVACGRFDGFWEPGLSPWDMAAGSLLVQEAGGRVSDFGGGVTWLFSGDEVIASNGRIHDEMLVVLRDGPAAPHPDFPILDA